MINHKQYLYLILATALYQLNSAFKRESLTQFVTRVATLPESTLPEPKLRRASSSNRGDAKHSVPVSSSARATSQSARNRSASRDDRAGNVLILRQTDGPGAPSRSGNGCRPAGMTQKGFGEIQPEAPEAGPGNCITC